MKDWGNEPRLIKGVRFTDDRGIVVYNNDFDMAAVNRWYMLKNHREGFVRAWHGHLNEAKWITCVSGVAIEAIAKIIRAGVGYALDEPTRYILHPDGDVLYVPPGYANGHKNIVNGTRLIHFCNTYHGEHEHDDIRFDASVHGWVWEEEFR